MEEAEVSYDDWKLATPPEYDEPCVRDDSTECDCPRCVAAEDRFWDEQGADRAESDDVYAEYLDGVEEASR
jgi:hypothetical protein